MAYTFIAAVAASANTSTVTTGSIDTTGADLIVVFTGALTSATTVTDSKGNTWTALTTRGSTLSGCINYCRPSSVGSGHTFTTSGGGGNPCLSVMAFSGSVASPFASENGGSTGSGTSQASGSVTPSETACLLVTGITWNTTPNGISVSAADSFTVPAGAKVDPNAGVTFGVDSAYLIQTTAIAENATWTLDTTACFMSVGIAVFKDSGSGGGGGGLPFFMQGDVRHGYKQQRSGGLQ